MPYLTQIQAKKYYNHRLYLMTSRRSAFPSNGVLLRQHVVVVRVWRDDQMVVVVILVTLVHVMHLALLRASGACRQQMAGL